MKITIFDRTKYNKALALLEKRKVPRYVIEAYKQGYIDVVNEYNKLMVERTIGKKNTNSTLLESVSRDKLEATKLDFLNEAYSKKDEDFMSAFFRMTNMDIMSGHRLPPSSGNLLKQDIIKDLGLKELFKKLK